MANILFKSVLVLFVLALITFLANDSFAEPALTAQADRQELLTFEVIVLDSDDNPVQILTANIKSDRGLSVVAETEFPSLRNLVTYPREGSGNIPKRWHELRKER